LKVEHQKQLIITQAVHWSFAIFLISMLSIGFYMKNTVYNPELYQLHKSFGVFFCFLVIFRFYWRVKYPWQSSSLGTNKAPLVNRIHIALITLMVLMPITGLMISAFSGFGIHLFGFFIVPEYFDAAGEITSFNETTYKAAKVLHNVFSYTFAVLIISHAIAALKHHVIDKDDTLTRMLPNKR